MNQDPLIGRQFANFRIERLIGRGGMAQIYYGKDVKLQRPVAIKVIDARYRDNDEYARRFVQEARTVATWRHENIIQVYYADDEDGFYYFVMEFIDGLDLSTLIQEYTEAGELIPHEDVVTIATAVANALDYAHAKGVIHRDIKPANIMIANDGRIVLMDFGLALDAAKETLGMTFGTPHYIAPEQARNSADAVPQSDLYAFGVVLYEMLVGVVPFDDPSATSLALQHLTKQPPPPRSLNPNLHPDVEEILLTALNKSPEDRYQTGGMMVKALGNALSQEQPVVDSTDQLPPLPAGIAPPPPLHLSDVSVESRVTKHIQTSITPPLYIPKTEQPFSSSEQIPPPPQTTASQKRSLPIPLPLIGGLIALLLIALVIIFVILPDDEPSATPEAQAVTETSTNEPVIQEASATSPQEASPTTNVDDPAAPIVSTTQSPSSTPVPPTNTATQTLPPSITAFIPTETSTIIPSPTIPLPTATATATNSQLITQVPTIAYPNGRRTVMLYDQTSFNLWNPTNQRIAIGLIAFEALDSSGNPIFRRFDGFRWTQFYQYVDTGGCVVIEINGQSPWLRPSECRQRNSVITAPLSDVGIFWLPQPTEALSEFRILWDEEEIARCPLVTESDESLMCEVFIP